MSAEPVHVEDPNDPDVILRGLPNQERGQFLRQYHEAVDGAHDPVGYRRLRQLLHAWRRRSSRPVGSATTRSSRLCATAPRTTPAEEAIPDWQGAPGGGAGSGAGAYRHRQRSWRRTQGPGLAPQPRHGAPAPARQVRLGRLRVTLSARTWLVMAIRSIRSSL